MERAHSWDLPAALGEPVPVLAAFDAGVTAICQLASRFDDATWALPTPCPEWRAYELAGHLHCVADDFNEYLDEAPASRYARLMASGAQPESLARKLARQNAAELAALADAPAVVHIAAFAAAARGYAARLGPVWDLPHHQYRDAVVTVGGMAGAACAEWHLHAWDLAAALGADYRPADPLAVLSGWVAGMPQLPVRLRARSQGGKADPPADPWHAVLAASGRPAGGSLADRPGRSGQSLAWSWRLPFAWVRRSRKG